MSSENETETRTPSQIDKSVQEWKTDTTAFDRVQQVAVTLDDPCSAAHVAEEACVAENTARNHLKRLQKLDIVDVTHDAETTLYAINPLYTRMQTLKRMLEQRTREELVDRKAELQEHISEFKAAYDAADPDALWEAAANTDTAAETREYKKTASEWEHKTSQLSIIEDAIKMYTSYNTHS